MEGLHPGAFKMTATGGNDASNFLMYRNPLRTCHVPLQWLAMTRGYLQTPPNHSELLASLHLTIPFLPQQAQPGNIGSSHWEESQTLPGALNLPVTSLVNSPWKLKFCKTADKGKGKLKFKESKSFGQANRTLPRGRGTSESLTSREWSSLDVSALLGAPGAPYPRLRYWTSRGAPAWCGWASTCGTTASRILWPPEDAGGWCPPWRGRGLGVRAHGDHWKEWK